MVEEFFREIAKSRHSREPITFHVIGSTALMLQVSDFTKGTDDTDVLEVIHLEPSTKQELIELAGRGSRLHKTFAIYLDIVGNGIPFLPRIPCWHPTTMKVPNIDVKLLDIVDVVVSKLKTFRPRDVDDIDAMVRRDLVSHARLLERFEDAKTELAHDARASALHEIISNLNRVERDMLFVDETKVVLPPWV